MSKEDIDGLLTEGLNTAVKFLERRGEFYPFAVVLTREEEVRHVHALLDDEHPHVAEVRKTLETSLKEGACASKFKAVAIVSNVELADQTANTRGDAIGVEIDDIEAGSVVCYLPYSIHSGSVDLGEVIASTGPRIAFGDDPIPKAKSE